MGHALGKRTVFGTGSLVRDGLLGPRWPNPSGRMP